ncbi:PREDICTED: contactin-6-like, partial [Branchiostoma belcheri]|uniref:Contactin-6-like n=1 Tax=Branchiostoma belcheri TaxID=7741 RepID=A0A6P4YU27_BRABE
AGAAATLAADLQLQEPDQVVGVEGTSVLLEGFAYGNPTPDLAWTRSDVDGNPLPIPAKATYEQWNRFINISNVQREDGGYYTVTATNTAGPPDSKRTLLVVA